MSKSATNYNGIETDVLHLPYEMCINMCGTEFQIARLTHLKKNKTPWEIETHAHLSWEFHYVLSGGGTVILPHKKLRVKGGQLYVTPPLFLHSQISDVDCLEEICIECNITPLLSNGKISESDEMFDFLNSKKRISEKSYDMCNYIDDINRMLYKHYDTDAVSPVLIEGTLSFLISHYIHLCISDLQHKSSLQTDHSPANQAVAIKNFIDANVCKNISTQDIADKMYISSRQIDRIFSKQYNMTSFQYLQSVRTKVAVDMIKGTSLSYKEIANTVGFSSYRNMIRSLYNAGYSSPSEIRYNNI